MPANTCPGLGGPTTSIPGLGNGLRHLPGPARPKPPSAAVIADGGRSPLRADRPCAVHRACASASPRLQVLILPRHLLQRLTRRHHARPGGCELPALTAGVEVRTSRCWPAAGPSPVREWRAGHLGAAISDAGSDSSTESGDKSQFVMSGDRDPCLCRRAQGRRFPSSSQMGAMARGSSLR
jgi:hypothetical protein